MPIIAPYQDIDAKASEALTVKRLTRQEAQALAAMHPSTSPWWVVLGQVAVGLVAALVARVVFGEVAAKSVACGALAVVLPAALFARGITSQFSKASAGAAIVSFFVWELVKIVVTLGVLMAAQRLVKDVSWPAMLVGLVVTLKVYWLALAFNRKPKAGAKG